MASPPSPPSSVVKPPPTVMGSTTPATPPRPAKSLPTSPKLPSSSPRRRSTHPLPTTPLRSLSDVALLVRKLRTPSSSSSSDILSCSSGPDPICHPSPPTSPSSPPDSAADHVCKADTQVSHTEHFTCAGAVDVPVLLRATRSALLDRVRMCGADALLDERWSCRIRQARHGTYRVHIEYAAHPARTGRPDPGRPVALAKARGVPGLMTIVERS